MLLIFGILVILASIILGLIVLVQNPKGGGLSGTFGGVGNQLMGVKQTTDVLEKGTWLFAGIVGLLCLMSPVFIPKNGSASRAGELINNASGSAPARPAAPAQNFPGAATPDTQKK